MKKYTLDELTDKYIGEKGSTEREQFEFELKLDILGEMIKKAIPIIDKIKLRVVTKFGLTLIFDATYTTGTANV